MLWVDEFTITRTPAVIDQTSLSRICYSALSTDLAASRREQLAHASLFTWFSYSTTYTRGVGRRSTIKIALYHPHAFFGSAFLYLHGLDAIAEGYKMLLRRYTPLMSSWLTPPKRTRLTQEIDLLVTGGSFFPSLRLALISLSIPSSLVMLDDVQRVNATSPRALGKKHMQLALWVGTVYMHGDLVSRKARYSGQAYLAAQRISFSSGNRTLHRSPLLT